MTIPEIVTLHAEMLERWGGQDGIRDASLLASAAKMPEASWGGEYLHAYPFEMAAAYAFHLAENQPFLDGNKRTAIGAALVFLYANGYEVSDSGPLYQGMMDLAAKRIDKWGLAEMLERISSRLDRG